MCLAIPSKVVKIEENDFAIVDTMGSKRKISTMLINEPISIGDYLLIHVGYAMQKINEEEAEESLKLFKEIGSKLDTI
ncbi:MAG: HypC/HybG/HupF family hydrogenase formation chaperone [Candidatus Acididesulfobacter diazotrophicus]|jgi:hydrogenase expression/formation protein HypC|uniref:HypC/HybG/HupF family hydrogenase formation chaperone n=1 Tax=Candidatus Acididesulfobacter diazotrophicus TaxID=2597226 RepID=A0A519BJX8_9DELT|nr:MAG: HypC/HybG/HupF family hydrogenase formation chaperone [Candidatus Acididesulfobacter diazotrophicus]